MLEILTGETNKILRSQAARVEVFDASLQTKIEDMTQTMLKGSDVQGIGLAANQVGILEQIIIITFNIQTPKDPKVVPMVNPQIIKTSSHHVTMEEGCLSLPNVYRDVSRPSKIQVRWQNPEGNWCEKKLSKWDARIFQHEYDHLQGKLLVDYD